MESIGAVFFRCSCWAAGLLEARHGTWSAVNAKNGHLVFFLEDLVVSNILFWIFTPSWKNDPILTNLFWNHQLVRTLQILVLSFLFTAFESIENYAGWNSKIVVRELPSYKDLNSRWALATYKCSYEAPIAENKWVGLFHPLELWAPKP